MPLRVQQPLPPFPRPPVLDTLANHWRYMNTTRFLADYGGAPNLLE